jgi:hypothetical protein
LVAKIIERRCTMLGLYTPPAMTLQLVEAQAPKRTSIQKAVTGMGITVRERQLINKEEDEGFDPQVRAEINQLRAQRGKPPPVGPRCPKAELKGPPKVPSGSNAAEGSFNVNVLRHGLEVCQSVMGRSSCKSSCSNRSRGRDI